VTELYDRERWVPAVLRYDIDSLLQYTVDTLPVDGLPWIAADLDRDGNIELVLQYADVLLIYSAPDWVQRAGFLFPGMNVVMDPVAVNLDVDPQLELFVTPNDLGGDAQAVVIDYDMVSGEFQVIANIPAPECTAGRKAVGDFDGDGRVEFIGGNCLGYGLFEWRDSDLWYVGAVGGPGEGNTFCASAVRPGPCGELCALLGYSSAVDGAYHYELLKAVQDNAFAAVHVFAEGTGFTGYHPNAGADTDCDGLDELAMAFPPYHKVWDWDNAIGRFVLRCDNLGGGPTAFWNWYPVDLDRNGVTEWGATNSASHFQVWRQLPCSGCDSVSHCSPRSPCGCACHGDPSCDGIRSDVVDVVLSVGVAFRGAAALSDPAFCCPVARSDLDCDGVTTVVDVVKTIDIAFRGADPTGVCNPCQ
jgi:hypothetical protein